MTNKYTEQVEMALTGLIIFENPAAYSLKFRDNVGNEIVIGPGKKLAVDAAVLPECVRFYRTDGPDQETSR